MKTVVAIVGKSGSGKSFLARYLNSHSVPQVDSYTTRPERHSGERGHIFVSDRHFDNKDMVCYNTMGGYKYGITYDQLGSLCCYVVDEVGLSQLKELDDVHVVSVLVKASLVRRIVRAGIRRVLRDMFTLNRMSYDFVVRSPYYDIDDTYRRIINKVLNDTCWI